MPPAGIKYFLFPFFVASLIIVGWLITPQTVDAEVIESNPSISSASSGAILFPVSEKSTEAMPEPLIFGDADSTETDSLQSDSLQTNTDSLFLDALEDSLAMDTIEVDSMALDSTARIKYFKHDREEETPSVPFKGRKRYSLYAYPRVLQRSVSLDSTGQFVVIRETIAGEERRYSLKIPIEEYIRLQLEANERGMWESSGYSYERKESEDDLGQLITDITNIQIPLPSTSFLSIFGPPQINLKINGAVDIHGAWRTETTEGLTASRLGNTKNEPDFKQQVQVNVNGTIGDKLTIAADWNTERTFEYENQLKIKYTGYEDEIVQSIEAGNVSLQTSPLVGGSEALFGIKAKFQLGPFNLTALASQKKGEIEEVSVSGGEEEQEFEIHAYEYSENHYFLDSVYADEDLGLFEGYFGNPVPQVNLDYFVKDIEVWKSVTGLVDQRTERQANAFIDLGPRGAGYGEEFRNTTQESVSGESEIDNRFVLLTRDIDYTLHPETGFITFKSQIQKNDAIAVAFRTEGPSSSPDDDIFYGEFVSEVDTSTTTNIVLKLVKPPNLQPQFEKAWSLQLKNIYPIGGRDIKKEGFELDIQYEVPGQEPRSDYEGNLLLQAFRLDETDVSGTSPNPDGLFDFIPGRTVLTQTGEIIFPVLQPFGNDFPGVLPDTLAYDKVYDDTKTFAKQDRSKDRFILAGKYSASVSSVYNIGFNVVENSVKVTLNGRELTPNVDYAVDYNIGQVTIRNDAALVPGADLKISYEQNDLFQLASKTLIGLRGQFDFSKRTKLGFSFLNLNQQTLSDKVRIGEEPLNNSILGADFATGVDLPIVTKALDEVISTREMSSIDVRGEYAYMSPDPNTKKSPIVDDNGQSIAYIDDFEGSKRIIPIGVAYGLWKDLSVPDNMPALSDLTKLEQMSKKGKSFWFNIIPSDVRVEDIFGNRKSVGRDQEQITVLDYVFKPSERGAFNYNPDLTTPNENWGGMMTKLSTTASNLLEENIEFIEFWLKIREAPQNTTMYIDLGQVSEDIIPNNQFDTEDINRNGLVDEGEDTGIDALFNAQERIEFGSSDADPSGDDFNLVQGSIIRDDYESINGTEGNAILTDIGRVPDSEDFNNNLTLDRINSYFRYEIPIDTNRTTNELVVGGGGDNDGWYQFRIPLKDYVETVGDPSLSVVDMIRVWVNGVSQDVHLRFAEFNLVGNQWQKVLSPPLVTEDDTVLTVSTISFENNPEYVIPPGIERERDRSNPDEEVFKNEQSLLLKIQELEDGDKREIVKFLTRPLDLFNYSEMKFFIHGDLDDITPNSVSYFSQDDPTQYGSEVYLRFGSDTTNYYEYRQPVQADWNQVAVDFETLTSIKQGRVNTDSLTLEPVPGKQGHYYGVRGTPTLTKVSVFQIGIVNPTDKGEAGAAVSGDIWVNELRVLGADDTPGWAYTASTTVKLADLMTIGFNISKTDPNFHKLAERFGSRIDRQNWGLNIDMDLLKLVPFNMEGSNLKVKYSHTENLSKPQYLPGTDIQVDQASLKLQQDLIAAGFSVEEAQRAADSLRIETETFSSSDTWTFSSVKLHIPSDAWYIRDTFNKLEYGFNYNQKFSRNPTTLNNESWQWDARINYGVNFGEDFFFYPADIPFIGDVISIFSDYRNAKVYFTPQSISWSLTAQRNYMYNKTRGTDTAPRISRDFVATRQAGFRWKLTEAGLLNISLAYSMSTQSSLAYLLTENELDRQETEIWGDIFGGEFFGRDYNHQQSLQIQTNPNLPSFWNINKFFRISADYSVTYNWQNNFQQEELGRSAGFANSINASMNVKLKSIFDPLLGDDESTSSTDSRGGSGRGRGRRDRNNYRGERDVDQEIKDAAASNDSTEAAIPDSLANQPGFLSKGLNALKIVAKTFLFDYESIRFNFRQTNNVSGGGLASTGTGFSNFWGIKDDISTGPTRLFMLGLDYDLGARAPNGNLTDNFSQKNTIDFSTAKPLWEGAQIDINWKVGWGITKSTSMETDSLGNITINNISSTGNIDRSFLSFPDMLFFSFFGNGIKKVNELYQADAAGREANPTEALGDAFIEGFETVPVLANIPFLSDVSKYIPRPNWRITWRGLEKLPFFSTFASSAQLEHAYTSNYTEGWRITPDGQQEVQTQRITYGFSPLVGLTVSFGDFLGGDLSSSVRYSSKSSFDLGVTTRNISESLTNDINLSASFSKSGFDIPLFGVSLKNDLEISLSYTSAKNSVVIYEMDNFTEEGKPQDGTTRTTIEPRIRYVMSSRVTLSVFYRRTSVEPEGAARIPPTTTNEAGLDVSIKIN